MGDSATHTNTVAANEAIKPAGCEKITQTILDESRRQAEKIMAQAAEKAASILQEAEETARQERTQTMGAAEDKAKDMVKKAESAAILIRRNRLLAERRRILEKALEETAASLHNLPVETYFDAVLQLAVKGALPGEGVLYFGRRDLDRLPGDFSAKLQAALPQGKTLVVSKETAVSHKTGDIKDGFVLRYADIEINCRFEALLEERREELEDLLNRELFA